ncbi:MAG: class I SAM-dependent rRNA methyltransferase [Bryobacteraceae bacterium]|nr:class I SAM-dependent rRNA methyltransferase [Bryobacteraceae bacterium]
MNQVRVNRRAEGRLGAGHLWIYASDVVDAGQAGPGEAVRVVNEKGRFLGIAHYSSASQIRLRLLTREERPIDRAFFLERLRAAIEFRRAVVADSDACRLVHAEADLLPALIVDQYGAHLAVQFLDQGMDRAAPLIAGCLCELLSPASILARNDVAVRRLEELPLEPLALHGEPPAQAEIRMNGLALAVDLQRGQKTGAFLDQRENYVAAARWARGRGLDLFTCQGGFALHAARRCETVEAVDSSAPALEIAAENARRNRIANIVWREANAFDYLTGLAAARRQFDWIVIDPPAFAKSRANLEAAMRGYRDLNYKALKILAPGGVLVTCSCSHHVSEADLLQLVASAGLDAGRTLRVLERRTQAADHPILLTVPETHYLKCLILQTL